MRWRFRGGFDEGREGQNSHPFKTWRTSKKRNAKEKRRAIWRRVPLCASQRVEQAPPLQVEPCATYVVVGFFSVRNPKRKKTRTKRAKTAGTIQMERQLCATTPADVVAYMSTTLPQIQLPTNMPMP